MAVLVVVLLALLPLIPGTGAGAADTGRRGYWFVAADGGVFSFGDAPFYGSTGDLVLNKPVVGMAPTPSGRGYWFVASDGGIFSFGDAPFYGSTGDIVLNKPIVGMAATPTGRGYWFVASDGGIFSYGDAGFFGSMGGAPTSAPIVDMAATPTGRGYWFVGADGSMYVFGDAKYWGSPGPSLRSPVVGITSSPSGKGYWQVSADGSVHAYGDARFHGSMGGRPLNLPVVGMTPTPSGNGYWLVASDGGIFSFGDAAFHGSTGAIRLNQPIVGMATLDPDAAPPPAPGGGGGGTSPTTATTSPGPGGTTPTTVPGTTPTTTPPPVGIPGDPPPAPEWGPPGSTIRIAKGTTGGGDAYRPWMSTNGRFVVFDSSADNILGKNPDGTTRDANGIRDVFVYDRVTDAYTRVSVSSDGTEAIGPQAIENQRPTISGNGRFVAFWSDATNLVEGDTNNQPDAFVHDRDADGNGSYDEPGGISTIRVSENSNGVGGNQSTQRPVISRDGRYVAFESNASNLLGGGVGPIGGNDSNGAEDVFVYSLVTHSLTRISVASDGTEGNGKSTRPTISNDGHRIAFHSDATNLVAGDTKGKTDVFLHDLHTGTTTRISVDEAGVEANGSSLSPSISADGRYVAFDSQASNLAPGEDTSTWDVYLKDLCTVSGNGAVCSDGAVTRVSTSTSDGQANGGSHDPSISGNGRYTVYWSDASDLVSGDTNGFSDVFLYDRETGTTRLLSVTSTGAQGNENSLSPAISVDGRYVAFDSKATNFGGGTSGQDVFVHVP